MRTPALPSRLARAGLTTLALALLLPARAAAQAEGDGRLEIHGYLTQGLAASDGAQFYGMRPQASTDFRYAALQFRYDRAQDGLVVQLAHRRLGVSPITEFESSVNVGWAFYERRSKSGATSLRIGRVPVPRGIYNEQRNIGVLLPFYRVPVIFYDEAAYFSETLDGAAVSHTFNQDGDWSVDVHGYGGGWSLLQYDQSGDEYAVGRVRAEGATGAQVWFNTPVEGVRVGASAQRYRWSSVDEGVYVDRQDVWEVQGSLDATFQNVFLRAESMLQNYESDDYYANYVQLGVRALERLWVNGQVEYAWERNYESDGVYPRNFDWHRVAGVGLAYQASPALVLKAEHHWNKGVQVEQPADPREPPRFRYFILSASTSF